MRALPLPLTTLMKRPPGCAASVTARLSTAVTSCSTNCSPTLSGSTRSSADKRYAPFLTKRELDAVLRNIRRLVSDSGEALAAIYNPLHLHTQRTELGKKSIPEGKNYKDTFVYTKSISIIGNLRKEAHRSISAYRQASSGAVFRRKEVLEYDGADTEELLSAAGHLVFRLAPMPSDAP